MELSAHFPESANIFCQSLIHLQITNAKKDLSMSIACCIQRVILIAQRLKIDFLLKQVYACKTCRGQNDSWIFNKKMQ